MIPLMVHCGVRKGPFLDGTRSSTAGPSPGAQ
jgi:hypothetical protein